MKIVIVGDGKVGDTLVQCISGEGHSVTVIDINSARINRAVNQYDVLGIAGSGASHAIQTEAGVDSADLFIAVTDSDELNMVCCMMAKSIGAAHTIARVRDPEYSREKAFMRDHLGIDLIVNPEYDTAREITRLIRFPAALKLDAFARGQVDMAEINISEEHPLAGKQLNTLSSLFDAQVLVCTVRRGDHVFIPTGDFTICAGDSISVTASHKDLSAFFGKLGLMGKPIRNVMLMGGGRISYYLAQNLATLGISTRIVEKDENRCNQLSSLLPHTHIILGDCTNSDLLDEEGLGEMDACISLTGNDEENAIVSMYAGTLGVERVITKINRTSFVSMLPRIGIDCTVSPRLISAATVLRYLRGLENGVKLARDRSAAGGAENRPSDVGLKSLYKLCDGRAEALEFDVDASFARIGIPLMSSDFRLKPNTLIASVVRGNTVIYPHGSTTLEMGDSVIVVTTNPQLCHLNDILEGE